MDSINSKILNIIRGWTQSEVIEFLKNNDLNDYIKFAETKNLDGFTFLTLSEGIVAMWRPKLDPKMLISVIEDLKTYPQKYYNITKNEIIKGIKVGNNISEIGNQTTMDKECTIIIKRQRPQVPKRIDSLKKEVNITTEDWMTSNSKQLETEETKYAEFSNKSEPINASQPAEHNFINLENIVAPKSFLYSDILINAVSKLYPYLPMKIAQDDVMLRKKTPFSLDTTTGSKIFQDAGYYEMTSRKSLNYGRRHSDSSARPEGNPYEELLFKTKPTDKSNDGKRFGILKKVLRKSTFRWERFNTKDKSHKPGKETSAEVATNSSRLQKINEMVVKKFSPKIGSNYKIKDGSNTSESLRMENTVKTVRFKQLDSNEDEARNVENEVRIVGSNSAFTENKTDANASNIVQYEEPDDFHNTDLTLNEHYYEEAEPLELQEDENIIDVRDVIDINCKLPIEVEDYLEPIQCFKVPASETVMDNLADEIIKLFDASMEAKDIFKDSQPIFCNDEDVAKEPCDNSKPQIQPKPQPTTNNNNGDIKQTPVPLARQPKPKVPMRSINKNSNRISEQLNRIKQSIDEENISTSNDRPFETLHKWNESLRNSAKKKKEAIRQSMIDRPLPVPVENEFYYMEIGRKEAEELLEGHADGTFILRPSSQSSHVYTVTLIYQGQVYNIGCRRRQDGRLALGFNKPGEQSFLTIHQLIQHYYTERLLLIQDGVKVGSTTLKKLHGS